MRIKKVDRVDHHGIVARTIDDLNIVSLIDNMVGIYPDEKVTTGEAIKAMIINGLGFTDRPLTLTPQFYDNCPMDLLFREGVEACDFNRFKLGRALDRIYERGLESMFINISTEVCKQEGIDTRFGHLDTTSFSVTGEYLQDSLPEESSEEDVDLIQEAVHITQGYSKDHRPDLKQVILELFVSQDGGVPLATKLWDGNTSDNEVFNARSKALKESFENGNLKVLIADSKLYSEKNAENLRNIAFITRIPETINLALETIEKAVLNDDWVDINSKKKYQEFNILHNKMNQRWFVLTSKEAKDRFKSTQLKNIKKEKEKIEKESVHISSDRFDCESDALKALKQREKKWKYHEAIDVKILEHQQYSSKGRPKKGDKPDRVVHQIIFSIKDKKDFIEKEAILKSCYIIGTNTSSMSLSPKEVIEHYKEQQIVERGFRFLKDPVFFVSSLFLKRPSRIEALLMVMVLALMVYAIAERRLRAALEQLGEKLPNQIKKLVSKPTLRWVFQVMEGIHRISVITDQGLRYIWDGLTEIRLKILSFFSMNVRSLYLNNST